MSSKPLFSAVAVAVMGFSGIALAQDGGGKAFGSTGTISPFGEVSFTMSSVKPPDPPGGDPAKSTDIEIAPGALYFVMDNLGVGAQLLYVSSSSGEGDAKVTLSGFGLVPTVGYNVSINEKVSIFPSLGFYYLSTSAKAGGASASGSQMGVQLFAPVLAHFGNFFLGGGPAFSMDISSKFEGEDSSKTTAFGVTSIIGGWF